MFLSHEYYGLIHFIPPNYSVFCTLPPQVQNRVMYPPSFLIACNVHYLKMPLIFLDEKACAFRVSEGKRIIIILNPHTTVSFPSRPFLLYIQQQSPKSKPQNPKEANAGLTLKKRHGVQRFLCLSISLGLGFRLDLSENLRKF